MSSVSVTKEQKFQPVVIRQEIIACGNLKYSMYKTELVVDNRVTIVYGIGVESTLMKEVDSCLVRDISSSYEKVLELFEIVVQNIVLPCTLKDIIVDYIS